MKHPPPEATSKQAYLEDLDRQVAAAHEGGAYTAVLQLAKQRRTDLQRDLAALLGGCCTMVRAAARLPVVGR